MLVDLHALQLNRLAARDLKGRTAEEKGCRWTRMPIFAFDEQSGIKANSQSCSPSSES
ncbi:hypothetical protein BKA80DRAFT_282519 [Phyllosticta citrichinensis]